MHRWLRYTVAAAVFAVLFTGSMLVAASRTEALPDDAPVLFETAPSLPGDRGLYKTALVVVHPDDARYYDMNAQYAFERVGDALFPVQPGQLAPTMRFVAEWRTGPYQFSLLDELALPELGDMPDCFDDVSIDPVSDPDAYGAAMEACGAEYEAWGESYGAEMEAWADDMEATMDIDSEDWLESLFATEHQAEATGWHATHHVGNDSVAVTFQGDSLRLGDGRIARLQADPWETLPDTLRTVPAAAPGPCGWRSTLQLGPQDLYHPIQVQGDCPSHMELGFATITNVPGPIDLVVSGKDIVDGKDAIVFSMPDDPDRLRLWFVEDRPYPVRILTRADAVPDSLRASMGPDWREPAFYVMHDMVEYSAGTDAATPAPVTIPLDATAVGATGPAIGDMAHPWPIAQAWQDMQDPMNACTEEVTWANRFPGSVMEMAMSAGDQWLFTARQSQSSLTGTLLGTQTQDVLGNPQTELTCETQQTDGGSVEPVSAPSFGWTAAVHEALAGTLPTDYGFWTRDWTDVTHIQWTQAGREVLVVDDTGDLMELQQPPSAYPAARFGPEGHDPHAVAPWRFDGGSGAFHMPSPATAATLAAGAGAAGLLIVLWPALKGLGGALPMFSRIRSEDLLQNPVRQQIHDIVTEQPGIHFQEVVRRLAKGRGTTEHHMRKLVAGDLLVEKAQGGYTCYFPRGAIDRNLMAAAPVLKSAGALAVMRAVLQQPGAASLEIAEALGMSTSTVNYHVKKLTEQGLVMGTRDGRYVRLHGTSLGEQALNQFAT